MSFIEDTRLQERNELLQAITNALESDERVVAAWLHGSIGRGQSDSWSDLDVWGVVRDESLPEIVAERYESTARLGNLVLTEEAPHNGPPAGAYFMTGFDFPTGLQLVDWSWQPLSAARKPESKSILFINEKLSEAPPSRIPYYTAWHPTQEEDDANHAWLAWAMLAIQAKYIVRKPVEQGMGFKDFLEHLINRGTGESLQYGDAARLRFAVEKLDVLDRMAADLRTFAPKQASPAESVTRFLKNVRCHVT